MLNKKNTALILIITFVLSLSLVSSASAGATETWFKPNVNIPGMERWLENPTEIDAGPMQGQDGYRITPDSIGAYISGIYDFVAGFVGIVAMFMLVIAGWQWLFASGNAERTNNAKQTINGVLIGLALLFGGHILLEQISVNLTQFSGISVSNISGLDADDVNDVTICSEGASSHDCGSAGRFQVARKWGVVATSTCPGGTGNCGANESCVVREDANTFDNCTMEYMISQGTTHLTGEDDCQCISNSVIQSGNFIRRNRRR